MIACLLSREKIKADREKFKVFSLKKNKVVVEGINLVKQHRKAQGMSAAEIVEKELPIPVANVMLICSGCQKPTRVSSDKIGDGSRVRTCKICQEVIE